MRRLTLLVATVALLAAGCGSRGKPASSPTSSTRLPSGQLTKNCPGLTASDISHVASIRPARKQALANLPGGHLRCSSLFIDSSGQLILEFTEASGGRAALAALRRGTGEEQGQGTVRPLRALGAGAFVARRTLAFTRGDRLLTLAAGYSADGHLQLTAGQLAHLASIVAARS
jgi:hypothetical protein